ncbi:5-formyltetrahydrofolate cyclo-ligase [Teredinibacter turnerae]|uniref:5-formyltetrahydrofolate cyclo-ligase n=1 Tax=Teredinibacter turnerae TaxID=2426 RepID=UPI00035ED8BD|nr:5-formyltetrahydrofolate cyclo-ligase [Teredinibacter turnerae]
MNKHLLRSQLRKARRALTSSQQQQAAVALCSQTLHQHAFRYAHHIAVYIANDGEISPHLIARTARKLGKQVYLPVVHGDCLRFRKASAGVKMWRNRFLIPEPVPKYAEVSANRLDLVLMPLVGFDKCGNRLGMGGGFYDRTFACDLLRPKLVGLAHHLQEVDSLAVDNWDIPLNAVATDRQWLSV